MAKKEVGLLMATLLGIPACVADVQSEESVGQVSQAWEWTSGGSDHSCWRYDDGNYSCHICYFNDGKVNGPNCVAKSPPPPPPPEPTDEDVQDLIDLMNTPVEVDAADDGCSDFYGFDICYDD